MRICLTLLLLVQAAVVGDRKVFLENGQYGLKYFPDGCIAVLQTTPQYRILMAAGISSVLLEGPDMASLRLVKKVLSPGAKGSFDNGYAGIYGTYEDRRSGELLAVYHAEDQEQMKRLPSGVPGFYASIGLAVSKDGGSTFTKAGPILTGRLPKDPNGRADQGCGEPSFVADKSNRFLYCYYTDHSHVDNRGVQICLARSPMADRGRPGTWKKYFEGSFSEPGLGGRDTAVLDASPGHAIFPQVTYRQDLDKYVMVFNIVSEDSGIYIAFSEDGIRWSKPSQLIHDFSIAQLDRSVAWHPTLIGDWLYYSYSPRWGHNNGRKPHYLVGQPIRLR